MLAGCKTRERNCKIKIKNHSARPVGQENIDVKNKKILERIYLSSNVNSMHIWISYLYVV